jgi:peptidyl-tRNA hydrolase
MYIIVGLGNPSREYENTRHNIGFDVVDAIIEKYDIPYSGTKHRAMYGSGMIDGVKAVVAKPLTYMNLSGEAVRALVDFYKIGPESELIIIYDDVALEPGKLRIRKKGSAGGHNGIKSIIEHLGTKEFIRIRVGVGEKPKGWDLAKYVLSRFSKDERKLVNEATDKSIEALKLIVNGEVDGAMNMYNEKKAKKEKPNVGNSQNRSANEQAPPNVGTEKLRNEQARSLQDWSSEG